MPKWKYEILVMKALASLRSIMCLYMSVKVFFFSEVVVAVPTYKSRFLMKGLHVGVHHTFFCCDKFTIKTSVFQHVFLQSNILRMIRYVGDGHVVLK